MFIDWTLQNNLILIESLIFLVLLMGFCIVVREIVANKKARELQEVPPLKIDDIEKAVQDVLGKAQSVMHQSYQHAGSASPEEHPLLEEIQLLRNALSEKDIEMQALKGGSSAENSSAAAGGLSAAQSDALAQQISELQAKLQEYEIISEDIADLTKFKIENQKLKEELDVLKVHSQAEAPAAAATEISSAPETASTDKEVAS